MPFATQNQLNSLEIHEKIKEEPPMTTAHYLVTVHLNMTQPATMTASCWAAVPKRTATPIPC